MYKNPKYVTAEQLAQVRYGNYKLYIDEFLSQLPAEQPEFSFDQVRDYFAGHADPGIAALAAEMTDGILEDLCKRHGVERV